MSLRRKSFSLPPGRHVDPTGGVRGYYVDFTEKTETPSWPPPWFPYPGYHRFMAVSQWGLGAHERYLSDGNEAWLAAAVGAGRHLVDEQVRDGSFRGGWFEPFDFPHTFFVRGPWLSAMAQGECVSLLVRLHGETGEEEFAAAALRGMEPMRRSTSAGGVQAQLHGDPFPEEYPTDPPAYVLNGSLFAVWGYYDAWKGLGDEPAGVAFRETAGTIAGNLQRWDTGYWSRYDLYPHPVINVASAAYHRLHITQLRALSAQLPDAGIERTVVRFEDYARSAACRGRAFGRKAFFRVVIPRNRLLARRLPWSPGRR